MDILEKTVKSSMGELELDIQKKSQETFLWIFGDDLKNKCRRLRY